MISAVYVLQARVLITCIFFLGTRGESFTNTYTCAHLGMCFLHCMHAGSFALTFGFFYPFTLDYLFPRQCNAMEINFQSKV